MMIKKAPPISGAFLFFLFRLVGFKFLDSTREGVEPEVCGVAFVEECAAEQFYVTELSSREFRSDKCFLGIRDGGAHASRDVYVDAGHLLGSSSIEIWCTEDSQERKIVFSGDIGNFDQPLIKLKHLLKLDLCQIITLLMAVIQGNIEFLNGLIDIVKL